MRSLPCHGPRRSVCRVNNWVTLSTLYTQPSYTPDTILLNDRPLSSPHPQPCHISHPDEKRHEKAAARLTTSFTHLPGSGSVATTYLVVNLLQRRCNPSSAPPMTAFISFQSDRPISSSFVLRGSFLRACFKVCLLSSARARSRRFMP